LPWQEWKKKEKKASSKIENIVSYLILKETEQGMGRVEEGGYIVSSPYRTQLRGQFRLATRRFL
jgi:hypothetical protein